MRPLYRIMSILLLLSIAPGASSASDTGSIYGVVRDSGKHLLAHVSVTLAGAEVQQVSTDETGEYRFTDLAPGEYKLSASLDGYTASEPLKVRLTRGSMSLVTNILLQTAPTSAPLQFQSAGIRGLIDPGGYSASTASAASDILRNMADVKRADSDPVNGQARDWPCELESKLQSEAAKQSGLLAPNLGLGQFYLAHDEPAKATGPLLKAHEIQPDDFEAARDLSQAWLRNHEFAKAHNLLEKLVSKHNTSEVHQLLARSDEGLGQFRQAAQQYRQANAEELSEQGLFGAGYELILAGAPADAESEFAAALERQPKSIALRIGMGATQLLQGKNDAAVESLLAAVAIDPEDARTYSFLASTSASSTRHQEELRLVFQRFSELQPQNAWANYFYALALSREGSSANEVHIETLLKQACALDPRLSEAHLQLAESYVRRNNYADAVPEYEAAVNLARDPGASRYRLALAYRRVGQRDKAERELKLFRAEREAKISPAGEVEAVDLAQFISAAGDANSRSPSPSKCPTSTVLR